MNVEDVLPANVRLGLENVREMLDEKFTVSDPGLREVFDKLKSGYGKMLRPSFLLLFAELKGKISTEHIVLSSVIEMIHTASLLHDDVVDSTDIRRNQASFNSAFGRKNAILMGDFLVSDAFLLAGDMLTSDISELFFRTISEMSKSELLQNFNRNNFNIDIETYLKIVKGKTAELFKASCILGSHKWANQAQISAIKVFAENFGIAYQLLNDYDDLFSRETDTGSLYCDLRNGCFTMPVIHCLSTDCREGFIDCINQERYEDAVSVLRKSRSNEFALQAIESYRLKAVEALCEFEFSDVRKSIELMTNTVLSTSDYV
ncbi:MAG: polyprenyl synthetase family protein [Sedimentisphaeraceae bacterium JB056]